QANDWHRNYSLFIIHDSFVHMPCAAYAVRSTSASFSLRYTCGLIERAESMNLTTHCSIACSIVGGGVHDAPHIFNAGKRLASKLFTIHHSLFIRPYVVRSLCRAQHFCILFSALLRLREIIG
ncbi:MAG: hypothetical protein IJ278_06495, partial [Clostridia bacterium]|nr:hypothetical protein [Clostridia bacterium]